MIFFTVGLWLFIPAWLLVNFVAGMILLEGWAKFAG